MVLNTNNNLLNAACPTLKAYIDYWDKWHKIWWDNITLSKPDLSGICGWRVPFGKGGNKNLIRNYFPEPYWGNPYSNDLVAVFININPAGGGASQHIKNLPMVPPLLLINNGICYSKTIQQLITDDNYITNKKFFIPKRVNWINNKLFPCLDIKSEHKVTLQNILCVDLIPWHTPQEYTIKTYIENHKHHILKFVIDPITKISQCTLLKGIVFARGSAIEEVLKTILTPTAIYKSTLKKGESRITVFSYNNSKIIVMSGPGSMYFFDIKNKRYVLDKSPEGTDAISISEIIIQTLNKRITYWNPKSIEPIVKGKFSTSESIEENLIDPYELEDTFNKQEDHV